MKKTIILLFAITLFFAGCKKDESLNRGDLILNGHAMVDLGLPSGLLWATCNVGASSPEDYGDYYAWGETKTKSEYNYTNSDNYGEYVDDISGNSKYDAARAKWGASWRIPTKTEFEELLSYCDLEMTEINGVSGCLVTGTNGNQIFLPATGYKNGESSMMSGSNGDYWSSTPESGRYNAYHFYFDVYNDNGSHTMSSYNRYYGRSVRAVSDRKPKGNNPEGEGGMHNNHAYVDLGLPSGLLWATCNVGANAPETKGDYYSWSEVSTKDYYSESNTDAYGASMNDISGKTQYDVARTKWGGSWRMPTKDEMQELLDNCHCTETKQNGVDGYKLTSKINGKSIFFPHSGYYYGSSYYSSTSVYSWTSSPGSSNEYADHLHIYGGNSSVTVSRRCYGQNVRAVVSKSELEGTPIEPEIPEEPETPSQPEHNGHAYVDLGLSVKWATCNIGASSPSAYGDYFAWGETTTKETYYSSNCPTYGLSYSSLQSQGYIDGEGNLTSQYDAARANWGGSWRMPTYDELNELRTKCTWTWTTQNSVNGYKVTGPSGASIFLPAAGSRGGSSLYDAGSCGYYWSSTPYGGLDYLAYYLLFDSSYHYMNCYDRYDGQSVRPVIELKGETPSEPETPSQPEHNGHAYVDLGLSVKWATCNIGASSPSAYGDYFAWGETKTKLSYYEGNCSTSNVSMSDFSGNAQYDAATANWGGNWRMPTYSEMSELLYNCTWTWTGQGYEVKSKTNGNSIFLPAAGYKDSYVRDAGSGGYYWVSSPYYSSWEEDKYADDLYFYSTNYSSSYRSRFFGHSIRPVFE